MKRNIFQISFLAGIFLIVAFPAMADLCVLKTGDYTLSGGSTPETMFPCKTADDDTSLGGTAGDGIIELEFSEGEDITLDIVFQQSTITAYQASAFGMVYMLDYDSANMTDLECVAVDRAGAKTTTDGVPGDGSSKDYFRDEMSDTAGEVACKDATLDRAQQFFFNATGESWPSGNKQNFVLDRISFTNGFSMGTAVYTTDFAEYAAVPSGNDDPDSFTDVYLNTPTGGLCLVLSGTEDCVTPGWPIQNILDTKINVTETATFVGAPTSASVTCKGKTGCTTTSGEADVILTYNPPTACYADAACSTASVDCTAPFRVQFTDLQGNIVTEWDGTFTETTTVGTVVSYTLVGVDGSGGNCRSSDQCTTPKTLTTTAVTCKCGDPPTVELINPTETELLTKTYIQGQDIKLKFRITDPDCADSGGMADSITDITFYYTNNLAGTTQTDVVSPTSMTNINDTACTADFEATIDKAYVVADTDIVFGTIVQDVDEMSGEAPASFDSTDMSANTFEVPGENIIIGSRPWMVPPYPNQFPFRPSQGQSLKIFFQLTDVSDVTMRIYSMDGRLIKQLDNSSQQLEAVPEAPGCPGAECNFCNWETGCQWDGTSMYNSGDFVANGMYVVNIYAVATGETNYGETFNYTKGIVVMK